SMCGIADDKGVESLAGIMGGEATGCSAATTDVLIESALWDAANIAETGRKLGIHSDARYRFERGVDPAFTVPGLELATAMVLELCGGEPSHVVIAGKPDVAARSIDFPLREVPRLAGLEADRNEVTRVLSSLGFSVQEDLMAKISRIVRSLGSLILRSLGFPVAEANTSVNITVPSWRTDVEGKADIVEEVVRILGVDRIPSTPFERGDAPRK